MNFFNSHRRELSVASSLLLILILTRSGLIHSHFGDAFSLPDASWSVFWLMGALTAWRIWPAILMAACLIVDNIVIANGVSAYCFTPAYVALIPAYGSLWFAGRWLRNRFDWQAKNLLSIAISLALGVSACFAISNVGFYLASGYFAQMPAGLYAQAVLRYWPHYLWSTGLYVATALLVSGIVQGVQQLHTRKQHQ